MPCMEDIIIRVKSNELRIYNYYESVISTRRGLLIV